jgi:quinoprotein glucose dehydrogenase
MTYIWHGRQYVVIAAGGHGEAGVQTSDAVVAFALPAPGEPTRSWWDRTIEQPGGHATIKIALILLIVGGVIAATIDRRRRRRQGHARR